MIAPEASAAFVANMEDVLEVYQRPVDPKRPLVCLDETSKQLIKETRTPIAVNPGQPVRQDHEYDRNGVANLFMMYAPLEGWRARESRRPPNGRRLRPRAQGPVRHALSRRRQDRSRPGHSARIRRRRSTKPFPPPRPVASSSGSNGMTRPSTEAGSTWPLDMAEAELAVLSTQCLDRRIPDKNKLTEDVAAWEERRNARHANANWQFTTADARIKLKSLYPST